MADNGFNTGRVKWYNYDKGYGFIKLQDGAGDVFLHAKELERAGIARRLIEGDTLSFKTGKGPKGAFATDVSLVRS